MPITSQILGLPGQDNAVLASVNTGQFIANLLFDCGDCLGDLALKDIRSIDHLFFSHLHMDHIAGFDTFFRSVYRRTEKTNQVWVPQGSAEIIHRRMQGFWWNLPVEEEVKWLIHEISNDSVCTFETQLSDGFTQLTHKATREIEDGIVLETKNYKLTALPVHHHGLCLAYRLDEADKSNMDVNSLIADGLKPGKWVGELNTTSSDTVTIEGREHNVAELKEKYFHTKKGNSLAYLSDFLLDEATLNSLVEKLSGIQHIVCESQFIPEDLDRALATCHMTANQGATLANLVSSEKLTLFHISDRYQREQWAQMLDSAKSIFPTTSFPTHWNLS